MQVSQWSPNPLTYMCIHWWNYKQYVMRVLTDSVCWLLLTSCVFYDWYGISCACFWMCPMIILPCVALSIISAMRYCQFPKHVVYHSTWHVVYHEAPSLKGCYKFVDPTQDTLAPCNTSHVSQFHQNSYEIGYAFIRSSRTSFVLC